MKRKAQGAIEYLFMIAAALIIIAIVIKYLRSSGKSTGETIQQGQAELNQKVSQELTSALNG
ncbi:class III signal peptide-containing protein [Thermococcus sp.]